MFKVYKCISFWIAVAAIKASGKDNLCDKLYFSTQSL